MANPLATRGQTQTQRRNLVQEFAEFRRTFKGDPNAKLNELLSSGQVTQQQVDNIMGLLSAVRGYRKK